MHLLGLFSLIHLKMLGPNLAIHLTWLPVINQGTGISLPIGTSLDGVPICELVPDNATSRLSSQEFGCTNCF